MTLRTGTERYAKALDLAHILINIDKLREAQDFLGEARDIYHDLEMDAGRASTV